MIKATKILRHILPFFPDMIKELEKSSILLERKYTALKKKEEENKKLSIQLKRTNIDLKKELKEKEKELKKLYNQIVIREKTEHRDEIQRIEKGIAGGFAHKIRNLYGPVILLNDKIHRNDLLGKNKKILLQLFNILNDMVPKSQFLKIIPIVASINKNQKRMDEILSISNSAINKNITITDDFLNYSDIKKSGSIISIDSLINSIINTHRKLLSHYSIDIYKELKYKKYIQGEYEQFSMVIQNLFLNALKAIKLKKPRYRNNKILIKTYFTKKDHNFNFEIKDTGIGIPEENLNNIFKPFFTTDRNEGTGLGLALCKKIVELYSGSISVKNNHDKGATFKIILPAGGF